jgi:hypothetical protein
LHVPIPFAAQAGAGPNIRNMPNQSYRVLAGFFRRARTIKYTPARIIEVAQPVGLEPVSQSSKQQMTGQMRGRSPAKYRMPTAAQLSDVEIAQARNLDIKRRAIRQGRTDPYARHGNQAAL